MNLEIEAFLKSLAPKVGPEILEGVRRDAAEVDGVLERVRNEWRLINGNTDLTAAGKRRHRVTAASEANGKLQEIAARAKGYDKHIAQLREQIKPREHTGDATVRFLQERECRTMLLQRCGENTAELQIMYQSACRDGGPNSDLIAEAIENSPLPLLPAEVLEAGMQARAQRQSPAEAAKLRELVRTRKTLADIISAARRELEADGGLASDDALSRVAAGDVA